MYFESGSQTVTTTTAALPSCGTHGVIVVKNTGTGPILVGQYNVNSSDYSLGGVGYRLEPGESVTLPPGATEGATEPNVAGVAAVSGTSSFCCMTVVNNG